ncbi:MAG: hypothetical protein WA021_03890 [Minisyncoccia bacterium]
MTAARIAQVVVVFLIAVLVTYSIPSTRIAAITFYEDTILTVAPSGERALYYADRHFHASSGVLYDLERAEGLYDRANELDPTLPTLQHQRARAAFLKGDFYNALALINAAIEQDSKLMPSIYMRGLIKGFIGDYEGAAEDYEAYLRSDPTNWAAINDYAWVLLKGGRSLDALVAVDWGLMHSPGNAWLLNSKATALFERGEYEKALEAARAAEKASTRVTEEEWLRAYPGNDPLIAGEGITALRDAIAANVHGIEARVKGEEKAVQ